MAATVSDANTNQDRLADFEARATYGVKLHCIFIMEPNSFTFLSSSHKIRSMKVAMISILGFVLMFLESSFIHAFTIPALFHRNPLDASSLPPSRSTVQLGLGPRLSRGASLYFPNSPEFANYTERWSATAMAEFAVVVVAAVDRDVAESVCILFYLMRCF